MNGSSFEGLGKAFEISAVLTLLIGVPLYFYLKSQQEG